MDGIIYFFFNDTATTEIYTLSPHDALPISLCPNLAATGLAKANSTPINVASKSITMEISIRARSEEHTSELQSRETISYAVFCLKKKISTHNLPGLYLQIIEFAFF